jgi:hypothetical protein
MTKELLSGIAIVITFVAFIPYVRSIHQGVTKPHVFTWVIWGFATFVVFWAQLVAEAGAGAWPTGISALVTIYVALLAYIKRADISINLTDWAFFVGAMTALPLWFLTSDPLWAVVILTTVDILGYGPTIRKVYGNPYSERVSFFLLMSVRNLVSIAAIERYSLTTLLFPAATAAAVGLLMAIVVRRRLVVSSR